MKKLISLILCCALVLTLAGCAGTTVVVGECTCPPEAHTPAATPTEAPAAPTEAPAAPEAPAAGTLKTGLAILPNLSKSVATTAEAEGKAEFDVTVVAVTVDENGVVQNCVIDSLGASVPFSATGKTEVQTKNELGFDYGMVKYNASSIGKEWFEQAAALAQFAVGKTVDQVKGNYSSDVDLATSATIKLEGYVGGIEAAAANAKELGAVSGDELKLVITASTTAEAGKIQLDLDAAALTLKGETVTSATIDSLQAPVTFDEAGVITSSLDAPKTKNELGFDYGMVAYKASGIGKEWFEQAEYFCDYITGKTLTEVATIAVDEGTKTTDVDLATGCTIAIGGFQKLIAKAAPAKSLKTGLAILPNLSKSASTTAEAEGKAEFDVTVVAVTVDENGVIQNCVIDSVGTSAAFSAEAGTAEVQTKNEQGFEYGMVKYNASSIGKEWFEQAAALADFAVGKTVDQVKGNYSADVDLATSATIKLEGYVGGIEAAAANAKELGAVTGNELKLVITASTTVEAGKIQLDLDAAALTLDGETVTSAVIDSLQAPVTFDEAGIITSSLDAPKTKNELGFDYGMVAYKASGIGKEWFEQAEYFCDYITGKTLTEVATIAVDEGTKTTDVDLATGCTIAIGGFQKLIAKAAG